MGGNRLLGDDTGAEYFLLGLCSLLDSMLRRPMAEALAEALKLADQISQSAPMAVWESRKVVLAAAYEDDATLKSMTNDAMRTVMASDDLKEGLAAFIEKRAPNWQGR